jgi:hypothetical protein
MIVNSNYRLKLLYIFDNFFEKYIRESPKTFYKNIIVEYFNVSYLIENPTIAFFKLFKKKSKDPLYLFFITLPKIIIATLFLIDVFYFNRLNLFFNWLPLLIIPLVFKCYLYMADHLADLNLRFFSAHLEFTTSTETGFSNVSFLKESPLIEGAFDIVKNKHNKELLYWFVNNFDIYRNIKSFIQKIYQAQERISPIENIYIYGCYTIGWFYILIIII